MRHKLRHKLQLELGDGVESLRARARDTGRDGQVLAKKKKEVP